MVGALGTGRLTVLGTRGVMGSLETPGVSRRGARDRGCARDRRGDSVTGAMGTEGVTGWPV